MVQTGGYYADDEVTTFRRYNSRGGSYALTHDRELPSGNMHLVYDRTSQQNSLQDARRQESTSDNDINSRPRSRIPVACQRCRKRKIRCSGDSGGACVNCRNAGVVEQCQFLRVQSQDMPLRTDAAVTEFLENNMAASQLHCQIVSQPTHYAQTQTVTPVYEDYRYRDQSLSSFQQTYANRNIYAGVAEYNDFDSQFEAVGRRSPHQVEPGSQQQAFSTHSKYMTPPTPTQTWEQPPSVIKHSQYHDSEESQYENSQMSFGNNNSYNVRGSISSASSDLKTTGIPTVLPLPLPLPVQVNVPNIATPMSAFNSDRLLPFPALQRPGTSNTSLRTNDYTASTPASSNFASFNENSYASTCEVDGSSRTGHPAMPSVPYNSPLGSQSPEPQHVQPAPPTLRSQQPLYHNYDDHYGSQGGAVSLFYNGYNNNYTSSRIGTTCYESGRDGIPTMAVHTSEIYVPYQREVGSSYPTPPSNTMVSALIPQRRTSTQPIQ